MNTLEKDVTIEPYVELEEIGDELDEPVLKYSKVENVDRLSKLRDELRPFN